MSSKTVTIEFTEGEARMVEGLLKEVVGNEDDRYMTDRMRDVFESARIRFTAHLNELAQKTSRLATYRRNKRHMNPIRTKADLEDYLQADGFTVRSLKNGNGGYAYWASSLRNPPNEILMDHAYPGDTRNWEGMYESFLETLDSQEARDAA